MYWRGETFYTSNEIYEGPTEERTVFLGDSDDEKLKAWMARHRGRRAFFLVEQSRYSTLETAVPADARKTLKIVDNSNMKFCLASADLCIDPGRRADVSLAMLRHTRPHGVSRSRGAVPARDLRARRRKRLLLSACYPREPRLMAGDGISPLAGDSPEASTRSHQTLNALSTA